MGPKEHANAHGWGKEVISEEEYRPKAAARGGGGGALEEKCASLNKKGGGQKKYGLSPRERGGEEGGIGHKGVRRGEDMRGDNGEDSS